LRISAVPANFLLPIRDAPAANLASALADEDLKTSPSRKTQASILHFYRPVKTTLRLKPIEGFQYINANFLKNAASMYFFGLNR
jgi:hypothetical protein